MASSRAGWKSAHSQALTNNKASAASAVARRLRDSSRMSDAHTGSRVAVVVSGVVSTIHCIEQVFE